MFTTHQDLCSEFRDCAKLSRLYGHVCHLVQSNFIAKKMLTCANSLSLCFGTSRALLSGVRGMRTFLQQNSETEGDLEMTFAQFVKNLHREESGQDLLEYALVLAAVLTAVVAGSASLANDISTALTTINTKIQTAIA